MIGEIPGTWNALDWMDETTNLIHFTSGGPWFEACTGHPFADAWLRAREEFRFGREDFEVPTAALPPEPKG